MPHSRYLRKEDGKNLAALFLFFYLVPANVR